MACIKYVFFFFFSFLFFLELKPNFAIYLCCEEWVVVKVRSVLLFHQIQNNNNKVLWSLSSFIINDLFLFIFFSSVASACRFFVGDSNQPLWPSGSDPKRPLDVSNKGTSSDPPTKEGPSPT